MPEQVVLVYTSIAQKFHWEFKHLVHPLTIPFNVKFPKEEV